MHIALRSMKVQGVDGNMRIVKPGDPVPEADGWKNVKAYENRGWIARGDAEVGEHDLAKAINAVVAERDATIGRLEEELAAEKLKNSDAPPSEPEGELEELDEPAITDEQDEPTDAPPSEPEGEALKLSKSELEAMAKGSLQALSDDLGINPDQSKPKLVKAILEAQ